MIGKVISGLKLPVDYMDEDLVKKAAKELGVAPEDVSEIRLLKRSVDARKKSDVHFVASVKVLLKKGVKTKAGALAEEKDYVPERVNINKNNIPKISPVVVGSGPAGLFAAMTLAKNGLNPIVIERGGKVSDRKKSISLFKSTGVLDTESNVQFGEGGAGTFSDGKLHTGIKDIRCAYVLKEFAENGAPEEILWQGKPHIGTDKLCTTIENMREKIISLGGSFLFNTKVSDVLYGENGFLQGLKIIKDEKEEIIPCNHAVFAIGHSARDTFEMLYRHGIKMEKKPFAVGLRIEHRREDIDRAMYGNFAGKGRLGAADYKLSCVTESGVGVYSFCMCPGGTVVPASSEEGLLAVNGMSEFKRDAENSNSALLVGISPEMIEGTSPLAGVEFQRELERKAFRLGGGGYKAPVQLAGDFIAGRESRSFGKVMPSYLPGVTLSSVRACLPEFAAEAIKEALPVFDKKIQGFGAYDAVLTGVESRSSSPVRILRDERGMSSLKGLYPCGEGAGYAGGITSAAVEGIKCAEKLMENLGVI